MLCNGYGHDAGSDFGAVRVACKLTSCGPNQQHVRAADSERPSESRQYEIQGRVLPVCNFQTPESGTTGSLVSDFSKHLLLTTLDPRWPLDGWANRRLARNADHWL